MRFKDYIKEDAANFSLDKFQQDCSFYFEQMKGSKKFLYHGSKNTPKIMSINTFKERSGPSDSPQGIHDGVNSFFKSEFDYPFRNGLFVTAEAWLAAMFGGGGVGVVFPIGHFEWLCNTDSRFDDLTSYYDTVRQDIRKVQKDLPADRVNAIAIQGLIKDVKDSKTWIHNKDLPKCAESGNEIMLKCDKFYVFNQHGDLFQDVVKPFCEKQ